MAGKDFRFKPRETEVKGAAETLPFDLETLAPISLHRVTVSVNLVDFA
jgi:hypothetical protein